MIAVDAPFEPPVMHLEVDHFHQPGGFLSPAFVTLDAQGTITAVEPRRPVDWPATAQRVAGVVVPGLPNLHSHAFQRAMAGLAEQGHPDRVSDSFWTWRTTMYRFAAALTPEHVEAIAAQVYVEMLLAGYTSVGEFHYLHHGPDGVPYAHPAELSARIHAAATRAGVALTLLPVFYAHGGLGQPPAPHQRRFAHASVEDFLVLWDRCAQLLKTDGLARLGVAPHSLRAVSSAELTGLVAAIHARAPGAPVHIHVAEQTDEVDACLAGLGARPVQFLLDHHGVDARWCLVHATHVVEDEVTGMAARGAVVGLCPTTEANLGDGVFPAEAFLRARGSFGVGSDSNVVVHAPEELRLLEAGQRLIHRRRNVLLDGTRPGGWHVGRHLWEQAALGGARALSQPAGHLGVGQRADLLVLDLNHPRLLGHTPDTALDALVMASGPGNPIAHVMVGGRWVVRDGQHPRAHAVARAYAAAMAQLTEAT